MRINPDSGYWSDVDCFTINSFVCKGISRKFHFNVFKFAKSEMSVYAWRISIYRIKFSYIFQFGQRKKIFLVIYYRICGQQENRGHFAKPQLFYIVLIKAWRKISLGSGCERRCCEGKTRWKQNLQTFEWNTLVAFSSSLPQTTSLDKLLMYNWR